MIKCTCCLICFYICSFTFTGCGDQEIKVVPQNDGSNFTADSVSVQKYKNMAVLNFTLTLNPDIYKATNYGEPPQIAIWLEKPDSGIVRTVWVTRRIGKSDWNGKVECLTALPYWVNCYNIETETEGPPTSFNPLSDVITGATPKKELVAKTGVLPGSFWNYYIEVNVSADYNKTFPAMLDDAWPDPDGNGQPSLVYKGAIEAVDGAYDIPLLVGRTEQWDSTDTLNSDLSGITNAKDIISSLKVTCTGK